MVRKSGWNVVHYLSLCWCVCLNVCVVDAQQSPRGLALNQTLQVADSISPLEPGQAKLNGFLGTRIAVNESNRLLQVDTSALIAPFKNRNGNSKLWEGEHIGKWLHAASLVWATSKNQALKDKLDSAVKELIAAQEADGYLGTYGADQRWTSWDVWTHKYNLLGLLAYYQYTRDQSALNAARKIGDLLLNTFGADKRDLNKAGEHVGMAATSVLEPMVLLYRASGDSRYLEFSKWIVKNWEAEGGSQIIKSLNVKRSVAETANGKAYELLSNLIGLCELYRSTGNRFYLIPIKIAWQDIVSNRLYPTGAISAGEFFTKNGQMPYSGSANIGETCAVVSWIQLNMHLYRFTGEAIYLDQMERAIYNQLLAAQKPDGSTWCYFTNTEGAKNFRTDINCCLSSGPRALALASLYAYSVKGSLIAVNFFESGEAKIKLANGVNVRLVQTTNYPFDGGVNIAVYPSKPARFTLKVRWPDWSEKVTIAVDRQKAKPDKSGYFVFNRIWKPGAKVAMTIQMPPLAIPGKDLAKGRVYFERGPIVYAYDFMDEQFSTPVRLTVAKPKMSVIPAPAEQRLWKNEKWLEMDAVGLAGSEAVLVKKPAKIRLRPFASAGASGSNYQMMLWQRSAAMKGMSLSMIGAESRSRQGNQSGAINDGDLSSFVVTYDGGNPSDDWNALNFNEPVAISRVIFYHGKTFHDGGWFDASQTKPRIQIRRALDQDWETVAYLSNYPNTTATDSAGLKDGQAFEVAFPQISAVAVRVIGKPACGDNPQQRFSSCRELEIH